MHACSSNGSAPVIYSMTTEKHKNPNCCSQFGVTTTVTGIRQLRGID